MYVFVGVDEYMRDVRVYKSFINIDDKFYIKFSTILALVKCSEKVMRKNPVAFLCIFIALSEPMNDLL